MALVPIDELPSAATIESGDLIPVFNADTDLVKRVDFEDLSAAVLASPTITGTPVFPITGAGSVPASAGASGTAGQIVIGPSYIYICIAADTWVRASISTWS